LECARRTVTSAIDANRGKCSWVLSRHDGRGSGWAMAVERRAGPCQVAPAALGLALFTIAASVMLVNFWDLPPGEPRAMLKGVFASNAAIVGGLLIAAAQAM